MNQRHCFDLKIEDQIAHLVLKRGEQLNTMTLDFWRELPEIMGELDREADARVVALSSTGKHFCAGMDLANFALRTPAPGRRRWMPAAEPSTACIWCASCRAASAAWKRRGCR